MDEFKAKVIVDKVVGSIFGVQNPFSLEQIRQKFAFDIRLPQQVIDSSTGETAWATSLNSSTYMTLDNCRKRTSVNDWMEPKVEINSVQDIISSWSKVKFMAANRQLECVNAEQCDTVYKCENIFRCCDVNNTKNAVFCDGCHDSEYAVAMTRSQTSSFCLRVEDSQLCSNSFNINWSAKITNSYFIQDGYELSDCMFCSHIAGKRFCIANMQFEEAEYSRIKEMVINWIFSS